jgi:hypothetical protein
METASGVAGSTWRSSGFDTCSNGATELGEDWRQSGHDDKRGGLLGFRARWWVEGDIYRPGVCGEAVKDPRQDHAINLEGN